MKRITAAFLVVLLPLMLIAASTQIDWTQIKNKPSFATVATTGAYSDLMGKPSLWNDPGSGTLLKRTGAFTFAAAIAGDLTTLLGFTPENAANKGAASGYAGLNGSSIVPTANLPACVASGASHASGLVPDPGASAGTTHFLREDCTWVVPSAASVSYSDGVYVVPLGGCGFNATSGAMASANTGIGGNPGMYHPQAGSMVLNAQTTAVASALTLNCNINPPSRLTGGTGVTVNTVELYYSLYVAVTSITAPTLSTNTFPTTGSAAADTVAAAGGVLTVTPGTLQLAATTVGKCYHETISLGTPVALNTDSQILTLEETFNQSGAVAQNLGVCGVLVHYSNVVQ